MNPARHIDSDTRQPLRRPNRPFTPNPGVHETRDASNILLPRVVNWESRWNDARLSNGYQCSAFEVALPRVACGISSVVLNVNGTPRHGWRSDERQPSRTPSHSGAANQDCGSWGCSNVRGSGLAEPYRLGTARPS